MQRILPAFLRHSKTYGVGLFFVVLLAIYWPALHGPFLWDDEVMVVGNPLIRSTATIREIFSASAFGHAVSAQDFFRPIQTLSYVLDHALFGLNPLGFHVMSLLYFILACLIFYAFLDRLAIKKSIAASTILLFSLHPLNSEAVSYISGRGDVLFLFFSAVALYATSWSTHGAPLPSARENVFFRGLPSPGLSLVFIGLAWLASLLALLSKENAVALPFVMASLWIFRPEYLRKKSYWVATVPPILGVLIYIIFRLVQLSTPDTLPLSMIAHATVLDRILTIPYILWTYFQLTFFPYPLHMDYLHVVTSVWNPYLWIGMPALGGLLYFLWKWTNTRLFLWCITWIIVGIGPVLQLVPLTATLREHWFIFSLIGALLLLVHATERLQKHIKLYVLVIIAILFGMMTHIRNYDWGDAMRLYTHDVRYEPRSFLLHNNIGVLHYRNGAIEKAKEAFQRSVLVTPGQIGYGTALNNLGVIAENERNVPLALSYYQRSIASSHYELAYANILRLFLQNGAWEEAYTLSKDARKRYPYQESILQYSAIASFKTGRIAEGNLHLDTLKLLH